MPAESTSFFRGLIILIVGLAVIGWILYRWLRTSRDDPGRLILKWILSGLIIVFLLVPIGASLTTKGSEGAFMVVFIAAGGLFLALIWTPNIAGWVGSRFENLYTGGDTPPEPVPFYSIAQARRKQGRYADAIEEVRKQLERFPEDVTGQFLLAEIQAENLKDTAAARETIEQFCNQPEQQPQNIAAALMTLADWHLKYDQNVDLARQTMESIIQRLPETEQALWAAQRLARLGSQEALDQSLDRTPMPMKPAARNIGLLKDSAALKPPEEDPEVTLADLINHLEAHPLDAHAREKLAVLYSNHYQDLGLARDQLNMLISQPGHPRKSVVHWLNLLADFQVEHHCDREAIQATLQRIVDLEPNDAAAELSSQRIARLNLELKGKEKSQVVKLGTYPQKIGLRQPPKE